MEKIKTINFGEQELISKENIEGVDGLVLAKIKIDECEPMIGFLDSEGHEIVKFGDIDELLKITILNGNTVVIDKRKLQKCFDQWFYANGSILCLKRENGFEASFDSNAAHFNIDDEKLIGACLDYDWPLGPVSVIEYNYKEGTSKYFSLCRWAYSSDRLQEYLDQRVSGETSLSRRLVENK